MSTSTALSDEYTDSLIHTAPGRFPHQMLLLNSTRVLGNDLVITVAHCCYCDLSEQGRSIDKTGINCIHPNFIPMLAINVLCLVKLYKKIDVNRSYSTSPFT